MTLPFHHIRHSHVFSQGNPGAEHKTQLAVFITLLVMAAEIVGGGLFNSMALLADGWHMSSHALALGLSLFAWRLARRYAHDQRFSFGSWKIEILGGYTSAVLLSGVAIIMIWESAGRLLQPEPIFYNQAISIASVGLLVNLLCAWLLKDDHDHHHGHHQQGHHHAHHRHAHQNHIHQNHIHQNHVRQNHAHQHHQDLNLRAAYIHVLADAATSLLAICALLAGKWLGAAWLDPVIGIVGALVVASWAYRLINDAGKILLDAEMNSPLVHQVRDIIDQAHSPASITDLHLWRVGKDQYACILALISEQNTDPGYYRNLLAQLPQLAHITVEVNQP